MNKQMIRAAASAALLSATVLALTSPTEAARSKGFNLGAEFPFTVDSAFVLEHSANGVDWANDGKVQSMTFDSRAMALKVGEDNAVYAPMYLRLGAGTASGATATIVENGLRTSAFEQSLRARIYPGVDDCSASGVSGDGAQNSLNMRGQGTSTFDLPAPTQANQPGEAVRVCVKAWMNDNNWLLGGKTPPTATATWRVTAQES